MSAGKSDGRRDLNNNNNINENNFTGQQIAVTGLVGGPSALFAVTAELTFGGRPGNLTTV